MNLKIYFEKLPQKWATIGFPNVLNKIYYMFSFDIRWYLCGLFSNEDSFKCH